MNNTFNIGDTVWFLEYWSQMPVQARITRIDKDRSYANLQWVSGGSAGCVGVCNSQLLDNLYHSRDELIEAIQKESNQKVAEYKASIKSVEDLVRFIFEYTVSCAEEYTDYNARRAAKERAKELLNIDIQY